MTADECHQRASDCTANAALAVSETVALEFMKLAAQWRAMAAKAIFLSAADDAVGRFDTTEPLALQLR
jgi:hypothetical protein